MAIRELRLIGDPVLRSPTRPVTTFDDALARLVDDLLDTVRLKLVVMNHALEPDDRVRARIRVETRGPGGGLWQDDTITVWYRLERGLIVEQDVDDSGRDGNAP